MDLPPLTELARRGEPFVLLDDARLHGAVPARLFVRPQEVLAAGDAPGVLHLLDQLDSWQQRGLWSAGWLGYEAGLALEPATDSLIPLPPEDAEHAWPLGWFAAFAEPVRIPSEAVAQLLPDPDGAALGTPRPGLSEAEHADALGRLLDAISAGDIYQANLTFNAQVAVHGHPLAAYARLRSVARAGYGGIVFTGTHWLLSLSPELFFSVRDGQVMARPMKGTARRGADAASDQAAARALATDPKQRAENLMIVDLLRNDLSRISTPGSVRVPSLFRVETYPTIHQMVSDVTAQLAPAVSVSTLLRATFPCGSITGAPKIQAMRTIARVEAQARGAYTGSIGFVAPDGEAAFNVAIRTLAMQNARQGGAATAALGLGSGIVADSRPRAEWRECLAKGEFVTVAGPQFDLIETMAFEPMAGIALLDLHVERLGGSAHALGFDWDRHAFRNRLQQLCFRLTGPAMLRARLSRTGALALCAQPMPAVPDETAVPVAIMDLPVLPEDVRLRHKTSHRNFYDEARAAAHQQTGAFEVLFRAPDGTLTEGSFTSLFVSRGTRAGPRWLTPDANSPALRGVLQRALLDSGEAEAGRVTEDMLAQGFCIGNAVRGMIAARLVS